jgi:hypothetical protein
MAGGGHKGSGGFRIEGRPVDNLKMVIEDAINFITKASENNK